MSLPHYFLEKQILSSQTEMRFPLELNADDAKHAKAARLKPGEKIAVIDASQDYFECVVESFDSTALFVSITKKNEEYSQKAFRVSLVQGLPKGDKLDEVMRHATELGVDDFYPIFCSRSIVKLDEHKIQNRMKRWNAILKSASMQSGRRSIPCLYKPQTLASFASSLSSDDYVLVCWEEAPTSKAISSALQSIKESNPHNDMHIFVVVGPEGGLSESEVGSLLNSSAQSYLVSLGSTILRTETAGIVAPALVLYELGLLGGCDKLC